MSGLDDAHEAWAEGRLGDARRGYQAHRDAWGARMQLAWLDAAFGRLAPADAEALRVPGLSESAIARVDALAGAAAYPDPLPGDETDWDIAALRARGAEQTGGWWLAQGKAASAAGLYGVADACIDEAEDRTPDILWDAPGWTRTLTALLREHLAVAAESPPP
jgi:hypothetical protein